MIYEFRCSNPSCDTHFDEEREVGRRNVEAQCPECGNIAFRQLILPNANTGRGSRIPGVCTTFGEEKYISNKHELREYAKSNNATTLGLD